jgi:hypothetical protein
MTIKFICSCGKHLKARDEMASRRSVCPRCGSPVGIPALKPTGPVAGVAPLTPLERLRRARDRKPLSGDQSAPPPETPAAGPMPRGVPRPLDPRVVHLLSKKGKRRAELVGRHLEKHWAEFLLYPIRAWRFCLTIALFLTVLSLLGALALPLFLAETSVESWQMPMSYAGGVLLVVVIVGLPCSFLDCVLASAAAGEVYYIRWSGNVLLTVLSAGARWLLCFLVGPVVFAGVGWLYWVNCGDPEWADALILAELGVAAVLYWLYALLALTERGRLRDLNPVTVADLGHRLGWRGLGVALLAAVLLLAHGLLLAAGAAVLHTAPPGGFLILLAGWMSSMFWSTIFCRVLGVWSFRSRQALAA